MPAEAAPGPLVISGQDWVSDDDPGAAQGEVSGPPSDPADLALGTDQESQEAGAAGPGADDAALASEADDSAPVPPAQKYGVPAGWPPDAAEMAGRARPEPRAATGTELSKQARMTAWVRGRVQGVGFRWWVRSNALELGLTGGAENLLDGRVKIVAEGNRDNCMELLNRLEGPDAPGYVIQVTHRWDQARGGLTGFAEL